MSKLSPTTYIAGVVESMLEGFVENDDLKQRDKNSAEWRNLKIRPDYLLETFGIPFAISQGIIGRLSVSVSWNILKSGEVIDVVLEDLYCTIVPIPRESWEPSKVQQMELERRRREIQKTREILVTAATQQKKDKDSSFQLQSFLPGFVTKNFANFLLSRLKISVRDVHIRFESGLMGFFPFSTGLVIPSIHLVSGGLEPLNQPIRSTEVATIKYLNLAFALYFNSNDQNVLSTKTTTVGAPDLLPRSIRIITQMIGRECESQLPTISFKMANVIPGRRRIDLWTNRQTHPCNVPQAPKRFSISEYIIPPTVMRARLSSPHVDTKVSIGLDLNTFLRLDLTTSQLQDILSFYIYHKEWTAFVYENVEAPALKHAFATKTCFRSKWHWAMKELRLRTQLASLKAYWFAFPARRLLNIHIEYLRFAKREFKLLTSRKHIRDAPMLEMLSRQLSAIEDDLSIPLELLLLWRRQAAGDISIRKEDLDFLDVWTDAAQSAQDTSNQIAWKDLKDAALTAATLASGRIKAVKNTVGTLSKIAAKNLPFLNNGRGHTTNDSIGTESTAVSPSPTPTPELNGSMLVEAEMDVGPKKNEYYYCDITFSSIKVHITQTARRIPQFENLKRSYCTPIPSSWWTEVCPESSIQLTLPRHTTLELSLERVSIEHFYEKFTVPLSPSDAIASETIGSSGTPMEIHSDQCNTDNVPGIPPYWTSVIVHDVYMGPLRNVKYRQDFYPDAIFFGDRPDISNLFVGAVEDGTRRPEALFVKPSGDTSLLMRPILFPPSLRKVMKEQDSMESCEITNQAGAIEIKSNNKSLEQMVKTETVEKSGDAEKKASRLQERRISVPQKGFMGQIPTVSYFCGKTHRAVQIWRPTFQLSKKSSELLSTLLCAFPSLRAAHLESYHLVVPRPNFRIPVLQIPPYLYPPYNREKVQDELYKPLGEVQSEAIKRCFEVIPKTLDRTGQTVWDRGIEYGEDTFLPLEIEESIQVDVKEMHQSEDITAPQLQSESAVQILVIDFLAVMQSFSRSITTPVKLLNESFDHLFTSSALPLSLGYMSQLPDIPVMVISIPFLSASLSQSSTPSTSNLLETCSDGQQSPRSTITFSMPRLDLQTWCSFRSLLLWRLDLELLSIFMGKFVSGNVSVDRLGHNEPGRSRTYNDSISSEVSAINTNEPENQNVMTELRSADLSPIEAEEVYLNDELISLLLSKGTLWKDVSPFFPIFSIDRTILTYSTVQTGHSSLSADIRNLSLYLYVKGVSTTSAILAAFIDRMDSKSSTRPCISWSIMKYLRQPSRPSVASLVALQTSRAGQGYAPHIESKSSETKAIGEAKVSSSVPHKKQKPDIIQKPKLSNSQIVAGKIVARALEPPLIPSIEFATRPSNREVLRSGWLFLKYPKLSSNPENTSLKRISSTTPRSTPVTTPIPTPLIEGSNITPLSTPARLPPFSPVSVQFVSPLRIAGGRKKRKGWAVWVEVVYIPPHLDKRKRQANHHRAHSANQNNALWIYPCDSVFDPRPIIILQPSVLPVENQDGFEFTTDRYVIFSAAMISHLSKIGQKIPPLGKKGKSVLFQFTVPFSQVTGVSFDPPSLLKGSSLRYQKERTDLVSKGIIRSYQHEKKPKSAFAVDSTGNHQIHVVSYYWCHSLTLDVLGFRFSHMNPPKIMQRLELNKHSDSVLQLFIDRFCLILGQDYNSSFFTTALGLAATYESTLMLGNVASVVCGDLVIENLTAPKNARRRFVLQRDDLSLNSVKQEDSQTNDKAIPTSNLFGSTSFSETSQNSITADRASIMRFTDLLSDGNSSVSSFELPELSAEPIVTHMSPRSQSPPHSTPYRLGSYWLPPRQVSFVTNCRGARSRRHFFLGASMNFDNGTSWAKIDPVNLILQPETVAELSNCALSIWLEFNNGLPSRSAFPNSLMGKLQEEPSVSSASVGFLPGRVLRSGPLPPIIHMSPLLSRRTDATSSEAVEVFAVSVSIVLLQAYTGSEVGRLSLVGLRIKQTFEGTDIRLAGSVLSGSSQLPLFIAPWSRSNPDYLDIRATSDDGSEEENGGPSTSSIEQNWFLHIQTSYVSPRLEVIKSILNAQDERSPDISELSVIANQSRVDLRYEELALMSDIVRDFQISIEPILYIKTSSSESTEAAVTNVTQATPTEASSLDTRVQFFLEEIQDTLKKIYLHPDFGQLSDIPISLIDPLLKVAQSDPSAYRRAIHEALRTPSFTELHPCISTVLERLAEADTTPQLLQRSSQLRLIRAKVHLPYVYWMAPKPEAPAIASLQNEPDAPMMFRLGIVTVSSEFHPRAALPPPEFTQSRFLDEAGMLCLSEVESRMGSFDKNSDEELPKKEINLQAAQCIAYQVEYKDAVLYFRSQESCQHTADPGFAIAARTFSLLSLGNSPLVDNISTSSEVIGEYMPLSTPVNAILTIWQVLQPTLEYSGVEHHSGTPVLHSSPRPVSELDCSSSHLHNTVLRTSSMDSESETIPSPSTTEQSVDVWSSVRLFIYIKVAPISVVFHPNVWTAIRENIQTSTVIRRAPQLRAVIIPTSMMVQKVPRLGSRFDLQRPSELLQRPQTFSIGRPQHSGILLPQLSEVTNFRHQSITDTIGLNDDWVIDPNGLGSRESALQALLCLPKSTEWASREDILQRQNTALLGSLASVTLHMTDLRGRSLFRAELNGCKGQKFGLMHYTGLWIDSVRLLESVSSRHETALPILEFSEHESLQNDACCFSWVTGPATSLDSAQSLNPSLTTTVRLSQPRFRIHPTTIGAAQLLFLRPDPVPEGIREENGKRSSFLETSVTHGSPHGTLEWLLGRDSTGTMKLESREGDEYESRPKRVAVWPRLQSPVLSSEKRYPEAPVEESDDTESLFSQRSLPKEENLFIHQIQKNQPQCVDSHFVPPDVLPENLRHMLLRAEWLSDQAERAVKDAASKLYASSGAGTSMDWSTINSETTSEKANFSKNYTIGPRDIFQMLGVFRYLDVSTPDEEDDLAELGLRCSTHTYVFKTDGVSIRIVVPSLKSEHLRSRLETTETQTEDLFLMNATFMGQMINEFLHLTVSYGDEKRQTSINLLSRYEIELRSANLMGMTTSIKAPSFVVSRNSPSNVVLRSPSDRPCEKAHMLIRPISGSITLEWRQHALCHLLEEVGISIPAQSFSPSGTFPGHKHSWTMSHIPTLAPITEENLLRTQSHFSNPFEQESNPSCRSSLSCGNGVDTMYGLYAATRDYNLTKELTKDQSDEVITKRTVHEQSVRHSSLSGIAPLNATATLKVSSTSFRDLCRSRPWKLIELCKEEPRFVGANVGRVDIHLDSRDLHAVLRLLDWLDLGDDRSQSVPLDRPLRHSVQNVFSRTLHIKDPQRSLCWWEHDLSISQDKRSDIALRSTLRHLKAALPQLQPYSISSRLKNFESPEVVFARYARQRGTTTEETEVCTEVSLIRPCNELLKAEIEVAGVSVTLSLEHRSRLRSYSELNCLSYNDALTQRFESQDTLWQSNRGTIKNGFQNPQIQFPIEGLPLIAVTLGPVEVRSSADYVSSGKKLNREDSTVSKEDVTETCVSPETFCSNDDESKLTDMSTVVCHKWNVMGTIQISGFNVEAQCWEPVVGHAKIVASITASPNSTTIFAEPVVPLEVSVTTAQLSRWRHGALLFQTEVLSGLSQWKIRRKAFWDHKRLLWLSSKQPGIEFTDSKRLLHESFLLPMSQEASTMGNHHEWLATREHLSGASLSQSRKSTSVLNRSPVECESSEISSLERFQTKAYNLPSSLDTFYYVVDLLSMRCIIVRNIESSTGCSLMLPNQPRSLPATASISFYFRNNSGLPVYFYFPERNEGPNLEQHQLAKQLFYVPPNVCVALDSCVLRPVDIPAPQMLENRTSFSRSQMVELPISVCRAHLIILTKPYNPNTAKSNSDDVHSNEKPLALRSKKLPTDESDHHQKQPTSSPTKTTTNCTREERLPSPYQHQAGVSQEEPKNMTCLSDEALPQFLQISPQQRHSLGSTLGKFIRRIFPLRDVFAVVPNINLAVPKKAHAIKRAQADSACSNVLLLVGSPVISHCPGQVGIDGLPLQQPLPIETKSSVEYVLSSGFLVKSYFPSRISLKFYDNTDQVIMSGVINDPGKVSSVSPMVQSKVTKIELKLSKIVTGASETFEPSTESGKTNNIIRVEKINRQEKELNKIQTWQHISFATQNKPNHLPSSHSNNYKRYAVVIQSFDSQDLPLSNKNGRHIRPSTAIQHIVIKAPLYVYNGLPVVVQIRLSDRSQHFDDSVDEQLLLWPCTGRPISRYRALEALFASFRLPYCHEWTSVNNVWSGKGLRHSDRGMLSVERKYIKAGGEHQVQFECHTSLSFVTPPSSWFGSCGALTMCLLPSRLVVSRLPYGGFSVASSESPLSSKCFAGDGRRIPFLCGRNPIKVGLISSAQKKTKTKDILLLEQSSSPFLTRSFENKNELENKTKISSEKQEEKAERINSAAGTDSKTPKIKRNQISCSRLNFFTSCHCQPTKTLQHDRLQRDEQEELGTYKKRVKGSPTHVSHNGSIIEHLWEKRDARTLCRTSWESFTPRNECSVIDTPTTPKSQLQSLKSESESTVTSISDGELPRLTLWQKIFCCVPPSQQVATTSQTALDIEKEDVLQQKAVTSGSEEGIVQVEQRVLWDLTGCRKPKFVVKPEASKKERGVAAGQHLNVLRDWSDPILYEDNKTASGYQYLRIGSYDAIVIRHQLPSVYPLAIGSPYLSPLPVRVPSLSQISLLLRGLPPSGFRPYFDADCAASRPKTFSLVGLPGTEPELREDYIDLTLGTSYSSSVQDDPFWYWYGGLEGPSKICTKHLRETEDNIAPNGEPFEILEVVPRFILINRSNFDLEFKQSQKIGGNEPKEDDEEENQGSHATRVGSGMSKLFHFADADRPYELQFRISSAPPNLPRHSNFFRKRSSSNLSQLPLASSNSSMGSRKELSTLHDQKQDPVLGRNATAPMSLIRRFRKPMPYSQTTGNLPSIASTLPTVCSGSESTELSHSDINDMVMHQQMNSEEENTSGQDDEENEQVDEEKEIGTGWPYFALGNCRPWTLPIPVTTDAIRKTKNSYNILCDDLGFWEVFKSCIPLKGEDRETIVAAVRLYIEVDTNSGITSIIIVPAITAPIHFENHTKIQIVIRQLDLPTTEMIFRPHMSKPYWLQYSPSAVLAMLQNDYEVNSGFDIFKTCKPGIKYSKSLATRLKDVIRKSCDGKMMLLSGALDICYIRGGNNHLQLIRSLNIFGMDDPAPIKVGSHFWLHCRQEGLTTVLSIWDLPAPRIHYFNTLKMPYATNQNDIVERAKKMQLWISLPLTSISLVGAQREIFVIFIEGISFNARIKSHLLPTHIAEDITGSLLVDLIQVDHHSSVNQAKIESINGKTRSNDSGEASYAAFRCPSSVVPYQGQLSPQCLNMPFALAGYRESVAPSCYPQLSHYIVSVNSLNAKISPVQVQLEISPLLNDIEDLIASLWTTNPIPVFSHTPPIKALSPSLRYSSLVPSFLALPVSVPSTSFFRKPNTFLFKRISVDSISIRPLTIRLYNLDEFLDQRNLLKIPSQLTSVCRSTGRCLPRWRLLSMARDIAYLASIDGGELCIPSFTTSKEHNHPFASSISSSTLFTKYDMFFLLWDIISSTNVMSNIHGLGCKLRIGWKIATHAMKAKEQRCNRISEVLSTASLLTTEGTANHVARCTQGFTRCIVGLSGDESLVSYIDQNTRLRSSIRHGFVQGLSRFMEDLRVVWTRAENQFRSFNFIRCIGILLLGPLIGLLEWISMVADGIRVTTEVARKKELGRVIDPIIIKRIPRMLYNTAASIRPYNQEDSELRSILDELQRSSSTSFSIERNYSFVQALRGRDGILVLCGNRILLMKKDVSRTRWKVRMDSCIGAVIKIEAVHMNPELFDVKNKIKDIDISFWNLWGYCNCKDCHHFYNTTPGRELVLVPDSEEPIPKETELDEIQVQLTTVSYDKSLITEKMNNISSIGEIQQFFKQLRFLKYSSTGPIE